MFSKISFLLITMLLVLTTASAQLADLGEKKPAIINGVEYVTSSKTNRQKPTRAKNTAVTRSRCMPPTKAAAPNSMQNAPLSIHTMIPACWQPLIVPMQMAKGLPQNRAM